MTYLYTTTFQADPAILTTPRAQLKDTAGSDVGAEISTGFVLLGNQLWSFALAVPDGHDGSLIVYESGDAANPIGTEAITPLVTEGTTSPVSNTLIASGSNTAVEAGQVGVDSAAIDARLPAAPASETTTQTAATEATKAALAAQGD